MTVSTLDLTPLAPARGVGSNAGTLTATDDPLTVVGQALARAGRRDYADWLDHVQAAAGCSRPIRLKGELYTIHRTADTATVVGVDFTDYMPDGAVYKACGNRRHRVCPSCAHTYQRDAYQVIRTMLIGGKGVPATVAGHGALFVTLTAPSFGTVHTRNVSKHTCAERRRDGRRCDCRPDPCHARRATGLCEHGRPAVCWVRHEQSDPLLGQPLCLDCYDHEHQVVWNLAAGELWRRTKQNIERHLVRLCRQRKIPFHVVTYVTADGKLRRRYIAPVRVAHGKAAEFQARGAVHFHVLLRLDGFDPEQPDTVLPPPAGITLDDLTAAVRHAADDTDWTTPAHPDRTTPTRPDEPVGWPVTWGEQLDVRPITLTGKGDITDSMVAGYLAKYATKSTEATGYTSSRLAHHTIGAVAKPVGTHTERLLHACWTLGTFADRRRPRLDTRFNTALPCACCGTSTRRVICPTCQHQRQEHRQDSLDTKPPTSRAHAFYQGLHRWAHMLGFGGHFLTKARHHRVTFGFLRDTRINYRRANQPTASTDPVVRAVDHDDTETTLIVGTLTYAGTGWRTAGDALLANTAADLARSRQQAAREELDHEIGTVAGALSAAVA